MIKATTDKSAVALISGSGSNLQAIIDAIENKELKLTISAVISNVDNAKGLIRAEKAGIATSCIKHNEFSERINYDRMLLKEIEKYKPDYIILAGFMRILTPWFINQYHGLIINIHPSLLPKFPGLNTHQRAIDSNEKWHGCTVHIVTEDLDGGPPIIQAKVPVKINDNSSTLSSRVLKTEHQIYKKALQLLISGQLEYKNKNIWLSHEKLEKPLEIVF